MNNQNTTDAHQQKWQAYLQGNDQAFETLYSTLIDRLYIYGCNLTVDVALVEDAIQEIFYKLYQRDKTMVEVKNIRSYLFVALRNHVRKSLSTDRNHDKHEKRYQAMQPVCEEVPVPTINGEESRLYSNVKEAIEDLPPRQKEVLCLKYYQGFDYHEISEIMNISYQVARNYASRGMKRLRKKLFAENGAPLSRMAVAGC